PLSPYTTLFRSLDLRRQRRGPTGTGPVPRTLRARRPGFGVGGHLARSNARVAGRGRGRGRGRRARGVPGASAGRTRSGARACRTGCRPGGSTGRDRDGVLAPRGQSGRWAEVGRDDGRTDGAGRAAGRAARRRGRGPPAGTARSAA